MEAESPIGRDGPVYSCVTLCFDCHTRGSLAYHHIGKRAFERSQSIRFAAIAGELRREWKAQRASGNGVRKMLALVLSNC